MKQDDHWTKVGHEPCPAPALPATEALPEVIASILAISHINRFSHIVMDGSPVSSDPRLQVGQRD